ncbi:MAG TPA: NUDIX domain-containing protein [Planctomycetaceae bacterium]|nr:NUDIX domain-containing protein [Planctomycetaceae bacterium]
MADVVKRVAIAVVEQRGRYLVGTRKPGEVFAGRAEFPGGKCQPDEDFAACAVRECREETGLDVVGLRRVYTCRHTYAHATLDLEFWLCRPASLEGIGAVSGGFEWVPAQSLKALHFPDANGPVIGLLAAGFESMS